MNETILVDMYLHEVKFGFNRCDHFKVISHANIW